MPNSFARDDASLLDESGNAFLSPDPVQEVASPPSAAPAELLSVACPGDLPGRRNEVVVGRRCGDFLGSV